MAQRIKALLITAIALLIFAPVSHGEALTPELCKAKAKAAAELVKAKGSEAFATLKDPNSEFIYAEGAGYIWIHNLDGKMLMHPIKPALEGKDLLEMRDVNGTYLFAAMNELVEEKGEGWVPYAWPKPGKKDSSPKVSYVVLVEQGGESYVVGSGMYDVTADDIKKQFSGDAIYSAD